MNWGVLKVSAVSWNVFRPEENKEVLPGTEPRSQAQVMQGDFLISRANTAELVARAVIVDCEPVNLMMSDKIVRLHLTKRCAQRFVWLVNNNADFARQHYARQASGASPSMKNVSRDVILELPFPLPSFAEQHRIVAKVDELMALCDQLEGARKAREATRDRLTASSFARLSTPDPATFPTDARFALDVLPTLTVRANQIKQLRQTILNLAVRGKLVPQDGSNQPVPLSLHVNEHALAELPSSWRYVQLGNVLREDTRNGYSRRPDEAADGIPILRISAGTVRRDGLVAEEEHKLISDIDSKTRKEYGLEPGDLLACRFNGNKTFVGRLTIFRDYLGLNPIYPDKLIRVRANIELVLPEFLRAAGESDLVRAEIEAHCATTVGNWGISASNLKNVRYPIAPVAEQRRIVAKLNELMALCDALEASLTAATMTRTRLLEAILREALYSVEMPVFKAAE